jgi:cytochrome c5
MSRVGARNVVAGALAMALAAGGAMAQTLPTPPAGAREPAKDYYQRSLEIYEFRKAAKSGPERGREIYYFKCWFCHNEYTQGIPKLHDLYKRPTLVSGAPVNDDNVKNQIRNGSANMAAYKYALNEDDIGDLLSFIKEKCCWDNDAPPANPRFRMRQE